ncbi:MAG TPA: hypothetical protein VIY48_12430 [Candidatus Paceibacterota bacterium]
MTDDHGQSIFPRHSTRLVTNDGRLEWVGPILPHEQGEFFLDGVSLGNVTLEQAMGSYKSSGTGAPVKEDRFNAVAQQRPTIRQAIMDHEWKQRARYNAQDQPGRTG